MRSVSITAERADGRLLPSAWIVDKEAWRGLTPAPRHAQQSDALQMRRSMFLRQKRKPAPSCTACVTRFSSSTIDEPVTANDFCAVMPTVATVGIG